MLLGYLFILILSIVAVFGGLALMIFLNIVMLLYLKERLDKRKERKNNKFQIEDWHKLQYCAEC